MVLQYQMIVAYLSALAGRFRDDDRGATIAEIVVITGITILAAGAISYILYEKLKSGANSTEVPAPRAP